MIKKLITLVSILIGLLVSATPAFAHAVVKPNQAGVGAFTDFTLDVPSEKEVATMAVKLVLPPGLNNVSPIVKPGWKIEVKTSIANSQPDDDGNLKPVPSEIAWTGGLIPAGQKDLFMFSAQVPAKETELDWKITQIYSDGSTVSWTLGPNDAQPKDKDGKLDYSKEGPYSKTVVVNDLTGNNPGRSEPNQTTTASPSSRSSKLALVLGVLAVLMSAAALGMQWKKR